MDASCRASRATDWPSAARQCRRGRSAAAAAGLAWTLAPEALASGVLALLGAAALVPALDPTAAPHALTAGAMGTMTLAIMTRAALGHSGRALTAGPGTTAIYALVGVAALARVLTPLLPGEAPIPFGLSGLAWIGAFILFVALYGPLLTRPRRA